MILKEYLNKSKKLFIIINKNIAEDKNSSFKQKSNGRWDMKYFAKKRN